MTKYFTAWDDFDVDVIGTNIAGWTVRGAGASTRPPAYGVASTVPFKRRYLAFTLTASAAVTSLSWNALDADANRASFDVLTCFIGPLATVDDNVLVFARGAGTAPFDCYQGVLSISSNVLVIQKLVSSGSTTLASVAFTVNLAKSYFIRFRGVGTTLSLKAWDAALGMAGEPAAWNTTVVDATFSAAGSIGLGVFEAAGAGEIAPFNFFAVGTNGDSAVCPRTNTEYTAWLASQTATRAVVAKMRCTGYDSSASPYTATRKVYLSNYGYTSQQQDSPSLQHFDNFISGVPAISREMPAALSGQAIVNFGRMKITNPASSSGIFQNLALQSCAFDNASYSGAAAVATNAATAPTGRARADQLTDASAVAFESRSQAITVPNDSATYLVCVAVKKTTGGTSTTFGFNATLSGGSSTSKTPRINTDLGTSLNGQVQAVQLTAEGAYWLVTIALTNNSSGNTTLTVTIYPATNTYNNASDVAATTGSAIVSGLWVSRLAGAQYIGTTTAAITREEVVAGIRDNWLRIHWLRDGFELLMGDPSWPLHDFRHVIRGRLGNPTAPSLGTMEFPIADMSEAFSAPLTAAVNGYPFKPKLCGFVESGHIEPPEVDAINRVFALSNSAITTEIGTNSRTTAYDNLIFIATGSLTVSAVNAGTDTLSTAASHGMLADYRVIFRNGTTPPAPLTANTEYWVIAAGLTATDFRLAATRGGAAIDITGATTGAAFFGYGYYFDTSAATMTLVAPHVGRVTITNISSSAATSGYTARQPADVFNQLLFGSTGMGLSLNYRDTGAFDSLDTTLTGKSADLGIWFNNQRHTFGEALDRIHSGLRTWHGLTADGLLQVGMLGPPAASAAQSFTAADVKTGTVRVIDTIRPVDASKVTNSLMPWFVNTGQFPIPTVTSTAGKFFYDAYIYGTSSIPLDDFPNNQDAQQLSSQDWLFNQVGASDAAGMRYFRAQQVAMFNFKQGIFDFETTLPALERSIGDTISLDFPRLGWKQYTSADPASPDNTATIDARLAVVIGHYLRVNQAGNSYDGVGLKVFRRIPGYYPTANLN